MAALDTLIVHMDEDAPGSVQIVPEDVVPRDAGTLSPLSEHDIGHCRTRLAR